MAGKLGWLGLLAAVGLSAGCETMAGTGALAGGGIGAGTGALIGNALGDAGAGAAIGGILGAGVGTAVGAEADQRERERADIRRVQAETAAVRGPMSLDDVIQMSRPNAQGVRVSDAVLCDYIRSSGSRFDLTPADVRFLADNGVSDPVVQAMLATRHSRPAVVRTAPQTVIVDEPPPVVVYERPWGYRRPYYWGPPPPPVGFGFSYNYVKVRK
jgi:hypothetical protein